MIFVTVGSRNYPFDRLFKKLDELYEMGILKEKTFAQIGTSNYEPKHYEYERFISTSEFEKKVNEASIVVSHGASGSIMKALNYNKKVIAVTRLSKYGEHINDHQIQNNKAFASNNYVIPVYEIDELENAFNSIYDGSAKLSSWENRDKMAIINMIDKFIRDNWY